MALGRLCGMGRPALFNHTISGWYGISGSMIGHVVGEGKELSVQIFGFCKWFLQCTMHATHITDCSSQGRQ
jgi:hypothetical protein